ncbi:MAG: N-acetylneuraminate synthase family protein [Elusimicrobia bacterium]|nr:N-acetylneuraminate synthase family protein [Elusimicrobiota bacterium]
MSKIIAEFCQNHNGERSILLEMVDAAAESGATYAKIQSIWVEDLVKREKFEQGQTDPSGKTLVIKRPFQPEYDRLKKLELSLEDHQIFIEACRKKGLIPLATIFAANRVPAVAALPWPQKLVKVASYDCASYPFLSELKKHFETLFVSTGATRDEEIEKAAEVLKGKNFAFFHCVTMYPNTLDNCHLARLNYLKRLSPQAGWSDHTLVARDGIKAAMAAMTLGADYVERHFTILPADQTKDGPVSITPAHLKELAQFAKLDASQRLAQARREIPEFDSMIGNQQRALTHEELLNRDYYRGRFATHKNGRPVFNWE